MTPPDDVDARIEALESQLARLRQSHDAQEAAKNALPRPPGSQSQSQFVKDLTAADARAVAARKAADERAEAAYQRARAADAPARERLERQIDDIDTQIGALAGRWADQQREHDDLERRRAEINQEIGRRERAYRAAPADRPATLGQRIATKVGLGAR